MAIKRNSCRVTERTRMLRMSAEGYSIPQISNAVSVSENIVTMVVDGTWAEGEKRQKAEQRRLDAARETAAEDRKANEAAVLGKAIASALKEGQDELTPQQRGAITRKENAAKKAAQEELEHGEVDG